MDGESMLSAIFGEPLVEISAINGAYVAAFRAFTGEEDEFGSIVEYKPIAHTDLDTFMGLIKMFLVEKQAIWRRNNVGELPQEQPEKPKKAKKKDTNGT